MTTIAKDGKASVTEKARKASGQAKAVGEAVVITYDDNRVERWKPAGKRMIVEHWFPADQYPAGKPTLGVAERRPEEPRLERVALKYVLASEAAKILGAMDAGGRGTSVGADERTNSLLLYGTPEQLAKYKDKLREIDVPKK